MLAHTLANKLVNRDRRVRVAYIGSYIPRACGIATFTKDITTAINILNPFCLAEIIAIDDPHFSLEYPWEVKYRINQEERQSYIDAAQHINQSGVEVVNIQHEFGIFGGQDGEYILDLMTRIEKPIVTTFHTVLLDPGEHRRKIVQAIGQKSCVMVVMIGAAAERLSQVYGIPEEKIVVIPHGVPDIPYSPTAHHKEELGLDNKLTLSTFGLINPGKGIESVIESLPAIVKKFPQVQYLVLGATHPNLLRAQGEQYRDSLQSRIKQLGLNDYVRFENRYLSLDELVRYLRATDVYVTPYLGVQQITSGTLAYAVGTGRPCISTPYLYAKEVLGEDRGVIVPFNEPAAITRAVTALLQDPNRRTEIGKKAYLYGRSMIWANVALKHLDLFWLIAQEEAGNTDEIYQSPPTSVA